MGGWSWNGLTSNSEHLGKPVSIIAKYDSSGENEEIKSISSSSILSTRHILITKNDYKIYIIGTLSGVFESNY